MEGHDRIIVKAKWVLEPTYESDLASGMDLKAFMPDMQEFTIYPGRRVLVSTGLFIECPAGYEAQVRPRSGLAFKSGVTVLNTPGTVDADYRGEVKVILINLSNEPVKISHGERIAQLVFSPVIHAKLMEGFGRDETERGEGGFGSTGTK